jgi:hypothetical protein
MSRYLTAAQLAELIGCSPHSFACMRRYLARNNWPFEPNLRGFPQVSREYHDNRMGGSVVAGAVVDQCDEPDFTMFKAAA